MSSGNIGMGKCSKIKHIVRLRQMLRRWRNKAVMSNQRYRIPSDVPSGHIAVLVGPNRRRFIVRTTYLNHPVFRKLLVRTEEEYGFGNQNGPLCICCDENIFEEIIGFLNRFENKNNSRFVNLEDFQRSFCHVGVWSFTESRPLLDKSVRYFEMIE